MYRSHEGSSNRWRGTFENTALYEFIKGRGITACSLCVEAHEVQEGRLVAPNVKKERNGWVGRITCASSCGEQGGLSGRRRVHRDDTGKADDPCAS